MQNDTKHIMGGERKNIIILSDFTESAWESVCFSFNKLNLNNHGVAFVQTFRKPDFGQSLLNNIVPVLRQIIRNELLDLKFKTLNKFKINENQVSVHPFEGDWVSFINYGQTGLNPDFLMISMKEAFPGADSNLFNKIRKIAVNTTRPLFILPDPYKHTALNKVLFFTGKELHPFKNIGSGSLVLSLIQKSTVDIRVVTKEKAGSEKFVDQLHPLTHNYGINPETFEIINPDDENNFISGAFLYDLIVIDQKLVKPSLRTMLNLKKWVNNKSGVPVLIC